MRTNAFTRGRVLPTLLLSLGLLLGSAAASQAQDTFFTTDSTISAALGGSVYVGVNALPPSQTLNTSPAVSLLASGSIGNNLLLYNSSTFTLKGGSIGGALTTYNNSTANLNGGTVGQLNTYDSSKVVMRAGAVSFMFLQQNSTLDVSGGHPAGFINLNDAAHLNVHGYNLYSTLYDPDFDGTGYSKYVLFGTLLDGTKLDGTVAFVQNGSGAWFSLLDYTYNGPYTFITTDTTLDSAITGTVMVGVDASPPLQTMDTSPTVKIVPGSSISNSIYAYNDSLLAMTGGAITNYLAVYGNSTAIISGGYPGWNLYAFDTSMIRLYGTGLSATFYIDYDLDGTATRYYLKGRLLDGTDITDVALDVPNDGLATFELCNVAADAGTDQTVAIPHDGNPNTNTTLVKFTGSASGFSTFDSLTFQWFLNGTLQATGPTPTFALAAGTYPFTLKVSNTLGITVSDDMLITVNPEPNQAPIADRQSVTTTSGTPVNITLSGSDPDNDPLTYTVASPPASGSLSGTAPNLTYTPNPGFHGTDTFTFTVTDSYGVHSTETAIVAITVNDPPVASDASFTTDEDTPLTGALPAADADGDPLTFAFVSGPGHGSVQLNPDGSTFTYVPAPHYSGPDSFTFKAGDGTAESNTATVTITVNPANNPPVAVDDTATTRRNRAVRIAVLANDSDPDGDTLHVRRVTQPASGTAVINPNSTITFWPKRGFKGTVRFRYTIRDGHGGRARATVTVTVTR